MIARRESAITAACARGKRPHLNLQTIWLVCGFGGRIVHLGPGRFSQGKSHGIGACCSFVALKRHTVSCFGTQMIGKGALCGTQAQAFATAASPVRVVAWGGVHGRHAHERERKSGKRGANCLHLALIFMFFSCFHVTIYTEKQPAVSAQWHPTAQGEDGICGFS